MKKSKLNRKMQDFRKQDVHLQENFYMEIRLTTVKMLK